MSAPLSANTPFIPPGWTFEQYLQFMQMEHQHAMQRLSHATTTTPSLGVSVPPSGWTLEQYMELITADHQHAMERLNATTQWVLSSGWTFEQIMEDKKLDLKMKQEKHQMELQIWHSKCKYKAIRATEKAAEAAQESAEAAKNAIRAASEAFNDLAGTTSSTTATDRS